GDGNVDDQGEGVWGAEGAVERQRLDTSHRDWTSEQFPRGVQHPADLRDTGHHREARKVARKVLEILRNLEDTLATVLARRVVEDVRRSTRQRPPPVAGGGNSRRNSGSNGSP